MMSKIRNLFNKIKNKVKKSEVDDEDEFITIGEDENGEEFEEDDAGEFDDDVDAEIADEEIEHDIDDEELDDDDFVAREEEPVMASNTDEDATGDIPVMPAQTDDDATGDIPVMTANTDEDATGDVPVMPSQTDDDATGDIPIMQQDDEITKDVPQIAKNVAEDEDTGDHSIEVEEADDIDFDDYDREAHIEADLTSSQIDDTIDLENSSLSFKDRIQHAFVRAKDKLGRFNRKKFQQLTIDDSKKDDAEKKIVNKRQKAIADKVAIAKTHLDRIDWKNIHREFFAESKKNAIHKVFQVSIIFCGVFILGKNTAMLLKGADKSSNISASQISIDESRLLNPDDIDAIKAAKVFKTDAQKPVENKPVVNQVANCTKADRRSSLPITLINTIVLQDSVKSIASVQMRSSSKQKSFREGEKIDGMAELSKIDRMKIILKNLSTGLCEYVEAKKKNERRSANPIAVMSPKQSRAFVQNKKIEGIESDGNEFTIEKNFIQDKLKDINSILTQARGIQLTNPDGSLSFKIVEIQPGSVFSYLGIENNDIITEIGGKKITDLNQVMSLFGKLTNLDKLNLKVKRGGEEVPLNYKFR
jgi:type II secretory pathway component PulC